MSESSNKTHGGKGDKHPTYDFKAKYRGLTLYHENCRRLREEGLQPMTPVEAESFLQSEATNNATPGRCDKTKDWVECE
tara:strand:- start:1435 stop:1671 length:237 start_codon:yes stop_codon:yes gene_type:complete